MFLVDKQKNIPWILWDMEKKGDIIPEKQFFATMVSLTTEINCMFHG